MALTADEANLLFNTAARAAEASRHTLEGDLIPHLTVLKSDGEFDTLMHLVDPESVVGPREQVMATAKTLYRDASPKGIAVAFDMRFKVAPDEPFQDALVIVLLGWGAGERQYMRSYRRDGGVVTFGNWQRVADA